MGDAPEVGSDRAGRGGRFASLWARFARSAGGGARARMLVLLAAILALDSADKGAISAVAVAVKQDLSIDNAGLGLIVTVVSIVGLLLTFPAGALVDRVRRLRLLAVTIVLWAVAMLASATATSYGYLLCTRIALGVVVAAAGPGVASLTGDIFADDERGRIYGYILTGELVGTGFGVLVAGEVTALASWRWSFVALSIPALVLAAILWRTPEPARRAVDGDASRDHPALTPWQAVRRVLSVRTNVLLIAASATGYFFFAGLRTFALVYARGHFGLSQASASALIPILGAGAVVGVLVGGRLADRLQRHGHRAARVTVAAVCPIIAAAILAPGFLLSSLGPAVALFTLAGVALGAANPAIDAARLDIMPSWLWGRAESVRTVLRTGGEAVAPVTFGAFAGWFAGPSERGLQVTFLIMLIPLAMSGVVLWRARHSYPGDAAGACGGPGRPVRDGADRSAPVTRRG
ncbi:MAG TPA: MFS transporter [Acidimicrobiales bacterium]|nr:MFS transporter [Acidimicrobiales bacterium]